MIIKNSNIAIIGGGAAGTMAALRGVLNNDDCLYLPGAPKNKKKSRAQWVAKVENMPAYADIKRGITGPGNETIKWIASSVHQEKLHLKKNRGAVSITKNEDGKDVMTTVTGPVTETYVRQE